MTQVQVVALGGGTTGVNIVAFFNIQKSEMWEVENRMVYEYSFICCPRFLSVSKTFGILCARD
jgi:hypothetical protein